MQAARLLRVFSGWLIGIASLGAVCAADAADLSPEMTRGLAWLADQVQSGGDLRTEAASIANPAQSRSEAAITLQTFGGAPTTLLGRIEADTPASTEGLGRQVVVGALAGRTVATTLQHLTARQNVDGGFGTAPGYASGALDTAWSVWALAYGGQGAQEPARRARALLASTLSDDGGPTAGGPEPRIEVAAMVLTALRTASDDSSATAVRRVFDWLRGQQAPDGGWAGDAALTALATIALSPTWIDDSSRAAATAFLLGRQSVEGSWDGDPFVTALALRALTARPGDAAVLVGSRLTGRVVAASNGMPLAGAVVAIPGTASAMTGGDGRFTLSDLPPGTHTVQISRSGFSAVSVVMTVYAGQTVDLGTVRSIQNPDISIVSGVVVSADGGAPLAGVTITIDGATNRTSLTDSAGRFELADLPPGAVTLTATLAGYQSVTGSVTLSAGEVLIFSPMLYPEGMTPPTTARLVGQTTSATGAPLAGVSIRVDGVEATTSVADGRFEWLLTPAGHALEYRLAGYDGVVQHVLVLAGTTVDAGTVPLTLQQSVTTLSGKVLDEAGVPIAGAVIQRIGGVGVLSGADGSYRLGDLTGASVDLRVTATGYLSQLLTLNTAQPGDLIQNFTLYQQRSTTLVLGDPVITPAITAGRSEVAMNVQVSNQGTASTDGVLTLSVLDPEGKVVGQGLVHRRDGTPLGQFSLAVGTTLDARLTWNTGQFPPAVYRLLVRVVEPGTMTRTNPTGNVIAERQGFVSVTAESHFTAAITANPPVLRAGLGIPVELSAVLQNDGNVELPAQGYTLKVIDTKDGSLVTTAQAMAPTVAVSGLQPVAFPTWTPTRGGQYRFELSGDSGQGLGTGSLYVGDSAVAAFTVDKLVVPTGTQRVRGQIVVSGQDVASGTISDPLAGPVRAAIQRAVTYNDAAARQWTISQRCQGCHIQTQALVGGELNRRFTTFDPLQRATIYNNTGVNLTASGALNGGYGGYPQTINMLGLWALTSYHDQPAIAATLKRATDWSVATQYTSGVDSGYWPIDYRAGWFSWNETFVAFNLKSVIAVHSVLGQADPQAVRTYSTRPFAGGIGKNAGGYLGQDGNGNLYFVDTSYSRTTQIRPDGSLGMSWGPIYQARTVRQIRGIRVLTSGSGLYRLNDDGSTTRLNNLNLVDIAETSDGRVLATDYYGHTIYAFDDTWNGTPWISGGGLYNPYLVSAAADGSLLIVNHSGANVLRIAPDKSVSAVIEQTNGNPLDVIPDGDGWLVSTTTGLYRYNQAWEGERLLFSRVDQMQRLPDGRLIASVYNTQNLIEIISSPTELSVSIGQYEAAIDRASAWLVNRGASAHPDNLPLAHLLIGLGEAHQFYQSRDPARASMLKARMEVVARTLRGRQNADGGWGSQDDVGSDSLITAQVGVALDYLDPSPNDPVVRKAVELLLVRQQADGSWTSENGVLSTRLAATTWVSIWLPIMLDRLGGIDTDLTATFPANVTLTNPSEPPLRTQVLADGSVQYAWKLLGVTAEGRKIGFDLTLAGMQMNEERPVALDAHLTFNNTFTNSPIDVPIEVPRVKASSFLELGVTTGQASYGPDATVVTTAQVTNVSSGLNGGSVHFEVFAPDGTRIADLGTQTFTDLSAQASTQLDIAWDTRGTVAGNGYFIQATLYDAAGSQVGSTRTLFDILPGSVGALAVSGQVATDKLHYLPSETVAIHERITNLTTNTPLRELTVTTTVTDPQGTVRFTQSESVADLAIGASRDFAYSMPIAFGPAEDYRVVFEVTGASGEILAHTGAGFTVASTAQTGSGLGGTLSATPKDVPQGDTVSLDFNVTHRGNAALVGLPLRVSILDPTSGQVIAEFPYMTDLAPGGLYVGGARWTADAPVGSTYVAALTATLPGTTLPLAYATFTVIEPPIKLAIAQQLSGGARVLVLAGGCIGHNAEHGDHEQDDGHSDAGDDREHDSGHHSAEDDDHEEMDCEAGDDEDEHAGDESKPRDADSDDAEEERRIADGHAYGYLRQGSRARKIDALLTALNVPHRVVVHAEEFHQALRSGYYNLYWLSGKAPKLHDDAAKELREAVYRGDGYLNDADHDERNALLDEVPGIRYLGKVGAQDLPVTLASATYGAGLLPSRGRALKLDVAGGVSEATLPGQGRQGPLPAMISRTYGRGRALLLGIDLVASLEAEPRWEGLLITALGHLAPATPPDTVGAGAYLMLDTRVSNLARPVDVQLEVSLPAGSRVLFDAPTATLSEHGASWEFPLAEGAAQVLGLGFSAPGVAGAYAVTTHAEVVRNGVASPYGEPLSQAFTVSDAIAPLATLRIQLSALRLASKAETKARDAVLTAIAAAQAQLAARQYAAGIAALVDAVEALRKITSIDFGSYRVGLDEALREAAWRWFSVQP